MNQTSTNAASAVNVASVETVDIAAGARLDGSGGDGGARGVGGGICAGNVGGNGGDTDPYPPLVPGEPYPPRDVVPYDPESAAPAVANANNRAAPSFTPTIIYFPGPPKYCSVRAHST